MKIIGITGGVGAGKTEVIKMIEPGMTEKKVIAFAEGFLREYGLNEEDKD